MAQRREGIDRNGRALRRSPAPRKKIPRYFFLNGALHVKTGGNLYTGELRAFSYEDEQETIYPLYVVMQKHEKAYTITQAAELLNQPRPTIKAMAKRLGLEHFAWAYNKRVKYHRKFREDFNDAPVGRWMISKSGVEELLEVVYDSQPIQRMNGTKRNGNFKAFRYEPPTRMELAHKLEEGKTEYYTRDADGNFVPVWHDPNIL